MRRLAACLVVAAMCSLHARAQSPGRERLYLKDGSYQIVRTYSVQGDRVRFYSTERGDWEEMPQALVDWKATEDWNHEHVPEAAPVAGSPAAQEAAELDREAAKRRAAESARQPEVAPGLRLPDESGVWALDAYNGTPELVRIRQSDGDLNLDTGHSMKAIEIPHGGARDLIRLSGYKAAVSFHVPRPVFYVALDTPGDELAPEDAMVVDTHGAAKAMADTSAKSSPASTYALVRLESWKSERVATAQQLSGLSQGGAADGSAPIVALTRRILPGGRWMRLEPETDLNLGQYSLVEVLPGGGMNLDGWDFGVNPMAPENRGTFSPLKQEDPDPAR